MAPDGQLHDARLQRARRSRVRWGVGALLFASTVINYTCRQTFSALAPILRNEFHLTNTNFASLLISFRIGYTVMQVVGGWLFDLVGSRLAFILVVCFYSLVEIATGAARGIVSLQFLRLMLGFGEGPNIPGATKTVSEWFPARERAWAVAWFDSGTSIGGALAPFIVLYAYRTFGSWRPAFVLTGCMGLVWVVIWIIYYRPRHINPRVSQAELQLIEERPLGAGEDTPKVKLRDLLGYKQAWGIILGRALFDPFWFFIAEWFALYLASKGYPLEKSILGFWMPFLGADVGNFAGAALSSHWISRGWPVGKARRTVLGIFGPSILVLAFVLGVSNYWLALFLFTYASFAYAVCSTMFTSLPADVFHSTAVGTVAGMAGTGAGIGTLISTYVIGRVTDATSFAPVIVGASIIPCIATAVFLVLVRGAGRPDPKHLLRDF